MDSRSCVAIVPARGGSKGVPGKNLALLAGRPLIAHTIEAARKAAQIGRVIVSTDSQEIADVALEEGAEVPFLRPAELARDDMPTMPVILHAVMWLAEQEDYRPEHILLLQVTSPLRTAQDIDAAISMAAERQADAVVSVCEAAVHPYWVKTVGEDGKLADFLKLDRACTRRQDLPAAYALNGAIYLGRRSVLVERQTWYTDRTYAYVMPAERSLEIDTPWDLRLAELIVSSQSK